jgi:hypothetical protein
LEKIDETLCCVTDNRDIRFIGEVLARIRFGHDVAQLRASQRHLSDAIVAFKGAQVDFNRMRDGLCRGGLSSRFDDISAKRRKAFKRTAFYQATSPQLRKYYEACRTALIHLSEESGGDQTDGDDDIAIGNIDG